MSNKKEPTAEAWVFGLGSERFSVFLPHRLVPLVLEQLNAAPEQDAGAKGVGAQLQIGSQRQVHHEW
ncbi:hypothetical protein A3I99_00445 [Candidatus Kaiserbacteria bacterium RIFCSPLOWO2_02_FULL_45_11b]|uniref:Uncharacterized protein n=1 Tax=Candidatus Kaiserbacteria bacterium RIFCSPLOWO2_12_FULL_45_26 TaxID=1798525 RepID=A0A1F6FGA9_9BACT|nr:MAG: hypothetical protein A2929_00855 [Candidatus Kaiserbacteria bacterium RIFCSPLOWO2_01_FULL_45_25]OGG84249.1 MAG: hypothetical protein A3I99_00445 [Candidatus Kaiserbacteria bacterium RIFCSPLOWO2_02_FULL_45_11b]OGG84897.1 MAG: hypothetical protein A3G90_02390 [Candidatus Kaiserbacteria bacterium RIFCSPLOWO2_12_FULL_45_26]